MTPRASVIVATRNRAAQVTACVECLIAQRLDPADLQIIVVDDGSTDDTCARLARLAPPTRVLVIPLAETLGRGRARNAGLERATGEFVLFVDSDAYAPPGFVRAHLDAHARHPRSIVDGPAILVRAFTPRGFASLRVRMLAALDIGGEQFVTVNTSCPRSALEEAGGFDPAFGLRYGWEDIDLGVRLRRLGLGRVKARDAFVLHESGTPSLEADGRKHEECGENAAIYYAKHPSPASARRIRLGTLRLVDRLNRLGATPERLAALASRRTAATAMARPLAASLYLRHRYAQGLARALTPAQRRELGLAP